LIIIYLPHCTSSYPIRRLSSTTEIYETNSTVNARHNLDNHRPTQRLTIRQELIYYSWIKMKTKLPLKVQCTRTTKRQKRSSSDLCTTTEQHILRYVPKSLQSCAVALVPVRSSKPDRWRGWEPDEERCVWEGNSNTNPSDAGNSDISSDLKHRANVM